MAKAARTGPRRQARLVVGRQGRAANVLIALNVVAFVVEVATGAVGMFSGGSARSLFDLGALQPWTIANEHQYWRLFTAMFLHGSILHILFNMYGLYLFGRAIEATLGTWWFLAIYFVSGLLASVTSYLFSDPRSIGVGASGAIFGLLGAWVAYNLRRRDTAFGAANLQMALVLIGLNLFLGLTLPNIDIYAHIGGLAAGFAAGALVEGFGPRDTRGIVRVVGFLVMGALGIALTVVRTSTLAGPFPL